MESQRKSLHKIIRRIGDLISIIFVIACIIFANRGF